MAAPPDSDRAKAIASFMTLMAWMVVVAVFMILAALLSFKLAKVPITTAMAIATIVGVGLSMLVGTGLMGLIFLSAKSGHDDSAAEHKDRNA